MKQIGEGSYATINRYKDDFYNKYFVIKKAKETLDEKEKERFKKEFKVMKGLSSPYIIEVYSFDEISYEYTMEYADFTINKYIEENNTKLKLNDRVKLVNQIIQGFIYTESKHLLHRDISTTNILIKKYDDVNIIKISDFGLVKEKNSNLTNLDTEFKGSLNDPKLDIYGGFKNYKIEHETYALVRLIYFIMTGRKRIRFDEDNYLKLFVEKGVCDDIENRYKSIKELKTSFDNCIKTIES